MNEPVKLVYPQWLRDCDTEKRGEFEKYEKYYKGKLYQNNDRFLILDWENTKDSSYSIHYFFRKDIGTFNMFMDWENNEITAKWFHSLKLEELLNAMQEVEDFASKVSYGDESLVSWSDALGLEELKKDREESEAFYGEDVEAMHIVMSDYDEMERLFKEFGAKDVEAIDEFTDLWYKYHDYDSPASGLGVTQSPFLYWGLKGLFKACEEMGLIALIGK